MTGITISLKQGPSIVATENSREVSLIDGPKMVGLNSSGPWVQ
jgi:hypothetical protein